MTRQAAAGAKTASNTDPAPAGSVSAGSRDEESIRGLVIAARNGDEAAFVSVYRTYAPAVYRFYLARVGCPEDAEDLLQQTFLRVVEALPHYEDRGLPFGAWLFRIARNVTVDQHRRRRDELSLDIEGGGPNGGPPAPRRSTSATARCCSLRSPASHRTSARSSASVSSRT